MINLLPPEEKERLWLEKKKRMAIILWFLALFFFVCLIMVLFSTQAYLKTQLDTQKNLLFGAKKKFEESEVREFREKINSTNLTLTKLKSFYQQKVYLTVILEKISNVLPQEAYLTNLSFNFFKSEEDKESGFKISLSGFVATREDLFEFKKGLEKEADFKEIYFPPVNWVSPVDIDFSVTFEIGIGEK